MREIKFRGMDANGNMRYGRLSQDKPNSTVYYTEYSQRICWDDCNIPVKNSTLGQYTGLKDNTKWEQLTEKEKKDFYELHKSEFDIDDVKNLWNGKEIYEGDIIKYSYPIGYSLCEIKFGIYDNGELHEDYEGGNGWYFEEHKFYYGRKTRGVNIYSLETGHYPLNTYECEVIGNIYNNPELLKEKP